MLEREGMLQVGRKQSTAHFFQSRKEDGFNLLSESEVAQSCPTLCDHMNCSLLGSSIHEIFQARILEWIAISFSRGASGPRDQACLSGVSCITGGFFTAEPPGKPKQCYQAV